MSLLESLSWRYATKKMDPSRPVDEAHVDRIIEAARLAPSSIGFQPYELVLVTNADLRQQLRVAASNQSQLVDGSHLLVFAAWDAYTPERINAHFDLTEQERGASDSIESYRRRMLETLPAKGAEANFVHAARQAYIGLGFALAAAAIEGVDSTPMEGFDPAAVDEILELRPRGLRSVALLMLGHRDAANDWLVNQKKVRRPRAQFVTERR